MPTKGVVQDDECLEEVERELRLAQDCHYECARWFSILDGTLIWMSVGLATLVSASVFSDATEVSDTARIIIGSLSALGAVALALQQNLAYGDRAKSHRKTGSKYGALVYEFESKQLHMTERQLAQILGARKRVSLNAPLIPGFIRKRHLRDDAYAGTRGEVTAH